MIVGVCVFVFGSYTAYESTQVEQKISEAEENRQGERRPRFGPIRRSVRAEATETAQEKINTAEQQVARSQVTADWLQGSGIALFLFGVGCLIVNFSHKKREK